MKPSDAPRLKGWVSSSEIATDLGISRQTVNMMIHAGEFQTLTWVGNKAKPMFLVSADEADELKQNRSFPRSKKDEETPESS